MKILKLLLASVLVCAAVPARAQSPTSVVITDANGKVLAVTGVASAVQVGSPIPVVITDANGKVIALGGSAGITFVAANPATCTPGITGVVELNVAPYTVSYCSATNTWTAIGAGGGGSGTVGSCSISDAIAYYTGTTTTGCDAGITTNGLGQLSATGGFNSVSDGVHMGVGSFVGNTTNPVGFPFSNSWGFLPPASASFTSWYIQPASAVAPAANCLEQLGAVSGSINPLSCPTSVFTSQTDAATVTWAIASALIANATLTFTAHSGSRALNITNPVNGGSYVIWLKQDGTGGEGLTLGTGCTWKVSGGGSGAITPSTGANAIDVLAFTYDGTNCYANFNKNFN